MEETHTLVSVPTRLLTQIASLVRHRQNEPEMGFALSLLDALVNTPESSSVRLQDIETQSEYDMLYAVRYLSHWDGEGDDVTVLAWMYDGTLVTHEGGVSIASLLAYKGDRILNIWPLRTRMQEPVCPLVEPGSIPVINLASGAPS